MLMQKNHRKYFSRQQRHYIGGAVHENLVESL